MHTSRDIRAIASQLVSVWLDIFRREKAYNGGVKSLKQTSYPSKSKSLKGVAFGKPPLRTHQATHDGSLVVSSIGSRMRPDANNKKLNSKMIKMENESKSDMLSSRSDSSTVKLETREEVIHAISEEEHEAFAAAEAARAAAQAAAEVCHLVYCF